NIPSPYTEARLKASKNKLIYYEASRGCPFRCAYCMAGLSGSVRYFSLERVKEDLKNIADCGAKTIKFTDRTFNMDTARTNSILEFIKAEFSGSDICFHFEVGGDLFQESTLDLLNSMPIGLVQLEAGVQTFNEKSLKAVMRPFNTARFMSNMSRIIEKGNIHTHLDLIAGLPFDTLETFK
ncbi:radical SAM protein, partial [bacterium]|nr:radical SAM protein [bacterium]